MFLIYADKYGHFECSVNFWQLLCLHVFWLVFDFCLFQKMDQWICIKLSARTHSECWLWHMVKLSWTEETFIGGTKCFPRAEKMWASMSTTDENIDEVKKIAWVNSRITVREVAEHLNILIDIRFLPMIWAWHGSSRNSYQNCSISTKNSIAFLAKNNTLVKPQPTYFPDLAPSDFFLFPKLKRPMKVRHYASIEDIKTASKEELNKITKSASRIGKKRWHKYK